MLVDIIFDIMNPLCFHAGVWTIKKKKTEDLHLKTGIAVCNLYAIYYWTFRFQIDCRMHYDIKAYKN